MMSRWLLTSGTVAGLMLAACADSETEHGGDVQRISDVQIVDTLDREPSFTQGLELLEDGTMIHSRGLYGESGIDILSANGQVLRSAALPPDEFGEGVTVVPGGRGVLSGLTAYQLTWKSGVVHTWSVPDLVEGPSLEIDGQGWGLCYDYRRDALWQSNGTSTLRLLEPDDLAVRAEVTVTEQVKGQTVEVDQLNELECMGGQVWANVWMSEDVVAINVSPPQPEATVTTRLSLSEVVDREGPTEPGDVANGITGQVRTGPMLVTGKNWGHIYRIEVAAH